MPLNTILIRSSFDQAKPLGIKITDKFYEVLFTDYPMAKALFPQDRLENQKLSLLKALVHVVNNVENLNVLLPYLKELGYRHVNYGVKDEHYDWVGSSLLKTFKHFFQDKWTDELNTEWASAYGIIASTMKDGAKKASSN